MQQSLTEQYRYFLKDSIRKTIDFSGTDQSLGVPPPPIEKPYSTDAERIDLIPPDEFHKLPTVDLLFAIGNRLLSVLDTALTIGRHNRRIEGAMRMSMRKVFHDWTPFLTLHVRW